MVPTRQSCRRNPAIPEMVGFLNVPRDKRLNRGDGNYS